jgi:hypothetical protein
VKNDEITLKIPSFSENLFSVSVAPRKSPLKIPGNNPSVKSFEVVFPKGYTAIEFMPESFVLHNPLNKNEIWIEQSVKTNILDDVLHLTVTRDLKAKRSASFRADYAPYFREWNRKASSRALRTITVRKKGSKK